MASSNSPHTSVSTGIFSLQPALLARRDFTRIATRYWWCVAIPVGALLLMGAVDWRWLVVALAAIFILIPTVAMFAWFTIMSRKAIITEIYPHRVSLTHEGDILVEYFPMPHPGNDETECSGTDCHAAATTRLHTPPHRIIRNTDITQIGIEGKHIVISLRTDLGKASDHTDSILIPADTFSSHTEAAAFFKTVASCINC